MNVLRKEKIYTTDYIYALPDGERAELIDGKIYYMAPPNTKHQRISSYLHNEIYNYITNHHGPCEIFAAPFAVFLNEDDTNYVEPDISVTCDPHKITNQGCHGAPDWVIEILSPSNRRHDRLVKLDLYQRAGVREYWIVSPEAQTVEVFLLEDGRFIIQGFYEKNDIAKVHALEGCFVELCKVFAE